MGEGKGLPNNHILRQAIVARLYRRSVGLGQYLRQEWFRLMSLQQLFLVVRILLLVV